MVKTQITQDFFLGAVKQQPKILYAEATNVSFSTRDKVIIVHIEKGYEDQIFDEITQQQVTKQFIVSNDKLLFTQNEMKDKIVASGSNFNSNEETMNMLADEAIRVSDSIIMNEITANPERFFNKPVELWKKV